jgi:DNA topoisomerase-2
MSKSKKTVEEKYQKLTQREHVLRRPGMYIGSIDSEVEPVWILESTEKDGDKMIQKTMKYNPGILKLFDEIITNASDHSRDNPVKKIEVVIDEEESTISVLNDGAGIPIEKHKEHKVYIPELIFANFLTGSNYDDSQKRTKGGMNGLGSKIVGTFSTEFHIETVSGGQKYKQTFRDNLTKIEKPKITKFKGKEYTKITFKPDLAKFGIRSFGQKTGTFKLLEKRSFDIAACTEKSVNISFNGAKLGIKEYRDYAKLYLKNSKETPIFYETPRWKVAIASSPFDKFTQISFVNGLHTTHGGKHVDHIVNQVVKHLIDKHKKKHPEIKNMMIKENLFVLVIALIENPTFKSQSKEELTTPYSSFGSRCDLDDKILKQCEKLELNKRALELVAFKASRELNASDGKKKMKLTGIPKLDDANLAGGKESQKCTLLLTEGDSAKTFAVSGMSVIGRDYYGVFPLKGKLLNVRTATVKQLSTNEEIKNIKQILGLQTKKFKTATDIRKTMRYGKILILTDSDVDGSHIKGLLVNFFHHYWELLVKTDFIHVLQTPIIKCMKGKQVREFFNLSEYNSFNTKGWKVKYYKGLGTSTAKEAKESFKDLKDKESRFYIKDESDSESIKLAFEKDQADNRKEWIQKASGKELYLDRTQQEVPITDFIHKELVNFSIYDCERSIPNIMDGLKPSQRKVLFGCFELNLSHEKKVFELCGSISGRTGYHHGDMSLNGTIIGMAQDFVGSNNINLLMPQGGFGSRLLGGKDAASPRYIFTMLNPITRIIFKKEDDPLLNYRDDDGKSIEPEFFYPTVCNLLINGTSGIGTGYSVDIPAHNPTDIVQNLRKLIINPHHMFDLVPWVNGFKGTIEPKEGTRNWISRGKFKRIDRYSIQVTELPVGTWTTKYKELLDNLLESDKITDFKDKGDESKIHFLITMDPNKLNELIDKDGICSFFKLESTIKSSNLTFFDEKKKLVQVKTTEEILVQFYKYRLKLYKKRYKYLIETLTSNLKQLSSKILFIERVINNKIKVFREPTDSVISQLVGQNFPKLLGSFDYLMHMRVSTFTKEKIELLENERNKMNAELETLESKNATDLWLEDLDEFEKAYNKLKLELK